MNTLIKAINNKYNNDVNKIGIIIIWIRIV